MLLRVGLSREAGQGEARTPGSERDAVRSQIRRIIEHLLKLAYSPAEQPRFDWMHSISNARAALEDKLSPTLRRDIEATLEKLYSQGRRNAALSLRTFGEEGAALAFPLLDR